MTQTDASPLADCAPSQAAFEAEVVAGLGAARKTLPCKYFYDARGSHLFDQICELPEYYPTRTELGLMRDHADEMAALLGPDCLLIEYGSGSSIKTRLLLDRRPDLAGYVPTDISREHLRRTALGLARAYPHLDILPLCADYTAPFDIPPARRPVRSRAVYFPGSTIGNFHPAQARDFLADIARRCGPGGGLLIGVDLQKPADVLEPAYDDAQGVTAAFNLNLLHRINTELGADFDLDAFAHHARYDAERGRIEMHLVSRCPQTVTLAKRAFAFAPGETILTEYSYKYDLDGFAALAASAGLSVQTVWTDPRAYFSVQWLVAREFTDS